MSSSVWSVTPGILRVNTLVIKKPLKFQLHRDLVDGTERPHRDEGVVEREAVAKRLGRVHPEAKGQIARAVKPQRLERRVFALDERVPVAVADAERELADVQVFLGELELAAQGTENLMPRILAAADAMATLGEMSDRLRRVFGEYREGA